MFQRPFTKKYRFFLGKRTILKYTTDHERNEENVLL